MAEVDVGWGEGWMRWRTGKKRKEGKRRFATDFILAEECESNSLTPHFFFPSKSTHRETAPPLFFFFLAWWNKVAAGCLAAPVFALGLPFASLLHALAAWLHSVLPSHNVLLIFPCSHTRPPGTHAIEREPKKQEGSQKKSQIISLSHHTITSGH